MRTLALIGLMACGSTEPPPAPPAAAELQPEVGAPAEAARLYDLSFTLEGMDGKELGIDYFKGSPVIMAMFYASCPQACPLLIGKLQSIDAKLPADQRQNLRVLLISMDPDRDTPQALADSFATYNLDAGRWKMARPRPQDVRTLAALLDVRYKQSANGEFSHNSGVTVVDREGHIRLRVEGLASEEARVTELLTQML